AFFQGDSVPPNLVGRHDGVGSWLAGAATPRRGDAPVRVIVTRPREQAGPLVARLEASGHEVLECPLIEIEPLSDDPIDAGEYDCIILTIPNGADELARRGRNPP